MVCPKCGAECHLWFSCFKGEGEAKLTEAHCLNPECGHWWPVTQSAPAAK